MNVRKVALMGIAGSILAGASLYVAAPQDKPLEFEVASIRPNAAGDNRVLMQMAPGGRLNMTGATLRMLIRNAFQVQDFQIIGGPGWMSSDRWDIQTTAAGDVTPNQVNEMLRNLLIDRFQLKFHTETRELPVYDLVVARNGPKLQEADLDAPFPAFRGPDGNPVVAGRGGPAVAGGRGMVMMGPGRVGGRMTMTQLAQMLGNNLDRSVIDNTGLTGTYDIVLSWQPEPGQGQAFPVAPPPGFGGERGAPPAPAPDPGLPSIFTAIQDQLGLRLQSSRGPREVIVIDGAQRPAEQQ